MMFKKLKTVQATRIRRANINTFLFFLFFALVIWFFVQFSKQYNEIINIPVNYVNIPPDKMLSDDNPSQVKLRMVENGFKIAWFSLFPPTLDIDVSKTVQENGKLFYVIDENREDILAQLNIDFDDNRFVKDALAINFEQKAEKILPVVPRISVGFAPGYGSLDSLQLEPDSVRITGPRPVLDTLNAIYTIPLELKKASSDLRGNVALDSTGLKDVSFYRNTLNYSLEVEKYTEGKVMVPIELINVPEETNVVIFPKETLLFYQVNLEDYNKVTQADFRVVADFSMVEENQDFLIPEIAQKSPLTNNLRLNEKKIQFIIKK